ncbi:MAG: hypothetical protein HUJ29_12665 [Gammaproteobacteria bacterium]|nr:hypothetical protein [Gammaproteobacteria bacterium]
MKFELDAFDFLNKLGDKYELSDLGKPILSDWEPIKGKFFPRVKATMVPDITTWKTDFLVLNQKALDVLKDVLEAMGELLPIEVAGETRYLFNPLTHLPEDVIDFDNSEYEYHASEEQPVGFKVLNFDPNKVPKAQMLFRVEHDFAYNLYCDDRFIDRLKQSELNGLVFNPTLIEPYFK